MAWVPSATRRAVAERYGVSCGGRETVPCVYCGALGEIAWPIRHPNGWVNFINLQLDHVIPVDAGGTGEPDNVVLACSSCNASKRNRPLAEWLAERVA